MRWARSRGKEVKGKDIPVQAVEALRVVKRRGCHIFIDSRLTDGSERQ
jgi:hypothetical protein